MGVWTSFVAKRLDDEKNNRKRLKEIAGWFPVILALVCLSLAATWGYFLLGERSLPALLSAAVQTVFEVIFFLLFRDFVVCVKQPSLYDDFKEYQKHLILRLVYCAVLIGCIFAPV